MITRSLIFTISLFLFVCACESNKAADASQEEGETTTEVQNEQDAVDPATEMAPEADAVQSAIDKLKQLGESDENVTVTVGTKGESGDGDVTATPKLIITIEAESDAHALQHAQELIDQGCFCTSTGPGTIECDCGDD